jgi:hypothetical protein
MLGAEKMAWKSGNGRACVVVLIQHRTAAKLVATY